jgi:hypothetical protein
MRAMCLCLSIYTLGCVLVLCCVCVCVCVTCFCLAICAFVELMLVLVRVCSWRDAMWCGARCEKWNWTRIFVSQLCIFWAAIITVCRSAGRTLNRETLRLDLTAFSPFHFGFLDEKLPYHFSLPILVPRRIRPSYLLCIFWFCVPKSWVSM